MDIHAILEAYLYVYEGKVLTFAAPSEPKTWRLWHNVILPPGVEVACRRWMFL